MTKTTETLLRELSKYAPVAIVSGRSLADLKERVQIKIPFLVGNHGLEGLGNRGGALQSAVAASNTWKKTLSTIDFGAGVEIEDKTYSLAIHYRRSRNKRQSKQLIKSAIAELSPPPRIIPGKQVVNLLPEGAPHKGLALLELMRKSGSKQAFYIGDDDTDEDVFGLPDEKVMSVRVGEKRKSQAKYYVRQQSELNRLLQVLINFYRQDHSPEGSET